MWFKFLTLLWENRPNTINVVVVIYLRHFIYFKSINRVCSIKCILRDPETALYRTNKTKLMIPTILSITRHFKITLQSKTGLADLLIIIQVVIDQNPNLDLVTWFINCLFAIIDWNSDLNPLCWFMNPYWICQIRILFRYHQQLSTIKVRESHECHLCPL